MFGMRKTPELLLFFCLLGAADGLYKQWIPDTNYENETNWDKGGVPCGSDKVQFQAHRRVAVFVETTHAVQEMRLPLDGEFILNSGAGFYVASGPEPGCGAGVTTKFRDSENLQWFSPALWQTARSLTDLQHGKLAFSVHEERVPCRHDDVVFKERSSFRASVSSRLPAVPVKSVSVLGETFESQSEFSEYLGSRTGQLQFHGSSVVTVGNPGCGDPSGCECGNSVYRQQICSSVRCGPAACGNPLLPAGHCCKVCGVILTLQYAAGFDLQKYRERINQLFLVRPQYGSIQVGTSKVSKSQRLIRIVPFGSSPVIQVLILHGAEAARAEALARDLVNDAVSNGTRLGISGVELQSSSANPTDPPGNNTALIVGAVFGVLLLLAVITVVVVLARKGAVHMPPLPPLNIFRTAADIGELGGDLDRGFDNPMFDKPHTLPDIPGLHGAESGDVISMTQRGVVFVNPAYDDTETDFNV